MYNQALYPYRFKPHFKLAKAEGADVEGAPAAQGGHAGAASVGGERREAHAQGGHAGAANEGERREAHWQGGHAAAAIGPHWQGGHAAAAAASGQVLGFKRAALVFMDTLFVAEGLDGS